MSAVAEIIDEKKYAALLQETLPHVIHTEEENERCIAVLESLDFRENLSPEEERIAELLTFLIEAFEEEHYSFPVKASPIDMVVHLMEANGLRQSDMTDVFGTESITSEVLNGKRGLAKSHIEKLSTRFNVSPALFFDLPVSQL